MIKVCMLCQKQELAWSLTFIKGNAGADGPGAAVRRSAIVLCEACYTNESGTLHAEQEAGGWRLQSVFPVETPGSRPARHWWSRMLGR